jgi:hypothetical protein
MPNSNDPILFDPRLTLPEGLKDAEYLVDKTLPDVPRIDFTDEQNSEASAEDEFEVNGGDDTTDLYLDVPSYMTIVEQIVRTAPDGTQVVDVVVDIEDINGAIRYDVRITK